MRILGVPEKIQKRSLEILGLSYREIVSSPMIRSLMCIECSEALDALIGSQ
jgi:hypothetical protein